MDAETLRGLKPRLNGFLGELADCFTRKDTRRHLESYVNGQLAHRPRKRVEPMALAAGGRPRTLQKFLSVLCWDHQKGRGRVAKTVCRDPLDGEIKYFVAHAPPETPTEVLLLVAFSRWKVQRRFQDGKQEVGLDHYEGRTWQGLIRHLILSSVSYLFLAKVHQEQRGKKLRS